jgi:HSP20 family protein
MPCVRASERGVEAPGRTSMERSTTSVAEWLSWARALGGARPGPEAAWAPAVDVYRTPSGWLFKFELAGVRREDVRVSLEGRRLRIEGARRDRFIGEAGQCYSLEISYSRFSRTIELPEALREPRLVVECDDGMLLVRVQAGP